MLETEFGVPIPGEILPESQWAKTAIKRMPLPGGLVWSEIFGRTAPVVVELGCGNGRFTLLSAIRRPDHDHFATDLLPVVIRYATRRANQRGLHNVRFAVKDAETVVGRYLAPGSVAEVHLYHPQPYLDPRMINRRLVTPRFLADVHRALRSEGLFAIQTDNPDYWDYIRAVTPEFFAFRELDGPWPDAPEGRSRREILSRSHGLRIFRGEGVRREDVTPDAALALAERLPPPRFLSRGPWCELDSLESRNEHEPGPRRDDRHRPRR
ncbi:MAG: putative S-adenosylmethionine-dependent methyltransferase [Planctomycetota bacterium]|nr:putative S-adenosylmethionine-dependent methyltransferase [Planctomycetota bacterium]